MDKQRAQSRSSPKKAGNRHGARAAPPRRRGHRREVGRHAGERGSGQATQAYLGAPTPTTTRLAKHRKRKCKEKKKRKKAKKKAKKSQGEEGGEAEASSSSSDDSSSDDSSDSSGS